LQRDRQAQREAQRAGVLITQAGDERRVAPVGTLQLQLDRCQRTRASAWRM